MADHGITVEQYDDMLEAQGGVCAICHRPSVTGKRLHVDHDHKTGRNRGLLCHHCNTALGNFRDDHAVVEAALTYLKEYRLFITADR